MRGLADLRCAVNAAALAAGLSLLPACGGGNEDDASPASRPSASVASALQGHRVADRAQALQIMARGVMAPLDFSERAHALLTSAFKLRANAPRAALPAAAGDAWLLAPDAQAPGARAVLERPIAVEIEVADNAEGLLLHGEAGFVRAVLRFDPAALGATRIEGAIRLEVSRQAAGAGSARRSQADALSITDGSRTLHWSYLYAEVDAQQVLRALNVVSDVPIDGSERVGLDVTLSTPTDIAAAPSGATLFSGRYVATGVISSLNAELTLQWAHDGGWTVDIDNDKDHRVDFVVQASSQEARALVADL